MYLSFIHYTMTRRIVLVMPQSVKDQHNQTSVQCLRELP